MKLDDDMTEEELDRLATDGTQEEMRAVAMHPNSSLQSLRYLASIGFAEDVDQNPLMLLHIEIGSQDVIRILENIAEQTNRAERLTELSSSDSIQIRRAVAWNKNTPSKELAILAKEKHQPIRLGVAGNEGSSPDTLAVLAMDNDKNVRWRVANNVYTKPEVLNFLVNDKDQNVRQCARVTLLKIKGIGR